MTPSLRGKSSVPLEAQDIVTEAIHGRKVESRINANYVAWLALKALQEAGYSISRKAD